MKSRIIISVLFLSLLINAQQSLNAQVIFSQYGVPFDKVPDPLDVTIYQVNIRTFSDAGNFQGVIDRLDSIQALGVNVIYLMPIYPVGELKAINSPYCIKNYKAVNKEFGSIDDLRVLVDGAHARKIAVILDWVANHTSYDHEWVSNKSWYLQNADGNIISPPGTGWNDVAQLNFSNQDMRLAMIQSMKYWVLTANIDGFRCDYSDGPPFDFWKQAIDTLRGNTNHQLIMLSEGRRSDNFTAGFDYNFGFEFFGNLKEIYENNISVKSIDSINIADYSGTSDKQLMVRYTSNHDVNSSDGTPIELFGGKTGSIAAFIVVAYMKSVPMIYNGQEKGIPYRLVFPFTSKNIDWSLNPDITAEYVKIIAFRNSSEAIRRGQLASFSNDDICAFTKTSESETVLVICNLRDASLNYTLPASISNSNWSDAFNDSKVKLKTNIYLAPYSYMVLKK